MRLSFLVACVGTVSSIQFGDWVCITCIYEFQWWSWLRLSAAPICVVLLAELIKAALTLNVKKCLFATNEVVHLGQVINKFELSLNASKVAAIMQMSRQEPQLNLNISWFLPVTNDHLFLILLQFLVQS